MNPNIKHIPSKEPKELEKLIAIYGVVKLKNSPYAKIEKIVQIL